MPGTVPSDNTLQSLLTISSSATKRKVDEVLYNFNRALHSTDDVQHPPAKKMRFPASLYSTLAKYGIKTKARFTPSTRPEDLSAISERAPHLSAILSRAAAKKEKQVQREELARASMTSLSSATPQSTPVEYRPSFTASFLSRLGTFRLSTYSSKPPSIDAVAAAKAGWVNEGKERLLCSICKASWILASRDGLATEAAKALIDKQQIQLIQAHKDGCPWKTRQCDDSIYCIPLKAPSVLAREIRTIALQLDGKQTLEGVDIQHPLTTSQVQALSSALSSVKVPQVPVTARSESNTENQPTEEEISGPEPSLKSSLTALFGWSLVSQASSHPTTSSAAPTSSISSGSETLSVDRQDSWDSSISQAGSSRPSRIPVRRALSTTPGVHRRKNTRLRDDTLLECSLCQRRLGLWAFKASDDATAYSSPTPASPTAVVPSSSPTSPPLMNGQSRLPVRRVSQGPIPNRQLDLLKEHRSYCPYVVRSTVVPSVSAFVRPSPPRRASGSHIFPSRPSPTRSASASSFNFPSLRGVPDSPEPNFPANFGDHLPIEGWRAILTMVTRAGLGRRQGERTNVGTIPLPPDTVTSEVPTEGRPTSPPKPTRTDIEQEQSDEPMETDAIQAMVEDVKKHGGKDLLRYVKSLFK